MINAQLILIVLAVFFFILAWLDVQVTVKKLQWQWLAVALLTIAYLIK